MAVQLEIRDGNPWYLSADIWVVPGTDPTGAPGLPIAGETSFLWAHVRNNGNSRAQDATVNFYWANPAVGFDRTTANFVGSANVTLEPQQAADVLCLTPWQVVWVNDGHECVLAEVFHPSDPPPPGPAFNVPTDPHVAQRNLNIVMAAKGMFHFAFEIHNPARVRRVVTIFAQQDDFGLLEPLLPTMGKGFQLPKEQGRIRQLGFVPQRCPGEDPLDGASEEKIEVELEPGARTGLSLVGRLDEGGALVNVVEQADGYEVGGLSVLVLPAEGR